jgi:hypothetical protein
VWAAHAATRTVTDANRPRSRRTCNIAVRTPVEIVQLRAIFESSGAGPISCRCGAPHAGSDVLRLSPARSLAAVVEAGRLQLWRRPKLATHGPMRLRLAFTGARHPAQRHRTRSVVHGRPPSAHNCSPRNGAPFTARRASRSASLRPHLPRRTRPSMPAGLPGSPAQRMTVAPAYGRPDARLGHGRHSDSSCACPLAAVFTGERERARRSEE